MYDTLEARLEELEAESNHVRTYHHEDDSVTVVLWQEFFDENDNPRRYDNLGVMCARGHRGYDLGDKGPLVDEVHQALLDHGPAVTTRWLRIFRGATVVLPLVLIAHSGISMYVGAGAHVMDPGGWDSGPVGLIFDTPETRDMIGTPDDRIEEELRSEVDLYDQYLQGEVYYAIHLWPTGQVVVTDIDRDTVLGHSYGESSCYGFLGHKCLEDIPLSFTDSPIREVKGWNPR